MEASDTFGAGVEAPADDPFASAEAEFEQQDPLADPAGEAPPVVNREGERVDATQVAPSADDEAALAEADRMREEGEAAMATDPDPEPKPVADPEQATLDASPEPGAEHDPTDAATAPSEEPGAEVGSDPTEAASEAESPASSATPTSDQEIPSSPAAADANAPAESPGDGGPSSAPATQPSDDDEAVIPEERKDAKTGAVTHRRYMLLQPDGEAKWSEVHWHEDKDGNIVKKGTPGAKKQKVCLARGQDDALAIGYNAVGSPPDGATLVAVALTYWNLRHVAPDPVPPIRQRLKIR